MYFICIGEDFVLSIMDAKIVLGKITGHVGGEWISKNNSCFVHVASYLMYCFMYVAIRIAVTCLSSWYLYIHVCIFRRTYVYDAYELL